MLAGFNIAQRTNEDLSVTFQSDLKRDGTHRVRQTTAILAHTTSLRDSASVAITITCASGSALPRQPPAGTPHSSSPLAAQTGELGVTPEMLVADAVTKALGTDHSLLSPATVRHRFTPIAVARVS